MLAAPHGRDVTDKYEVAEILYIIVSKVPHISGWII